MVTGVNETVIQYLYKENLIKKKMQRGLPEGLGAEGGSACQVMSL